MWAAGAIVSTDEDVARFFRALLSGRLMARGCCAQMQRAHAQEHQVDFPGQRYGLGLVSFPRLRHGLGPQRRHPRLLHVRFSTRDGRRQMWLTVNQDGARYRARRRKRSGQRSSRVLRMPASAAMRPPRTAATSAAWSRSFWSA